MLLARAAGVPVVSIAALVQQPLLCVMSLQDRAITRPADLRGATVGFPGIPSQEAALATMLAARVDHLYVHVDADVLDSALQPNHPTVELGGPDVAAVRVVLDHAFACGKALAYGVVSVNPTGDGGAISLASGTALLTAGVAAWTRAGGPAV